MSNCIPWSLKRWHGCAYVKRFAIVSLNLAGLVSVFFVNRIKTTARLVQVFHHLSNHLAVRFNAIADAPHNFNVITLSLSTKGRSRSEICILSGFFFAKKL